MKKILTIILGMVIATGSTIASKRPEDIPSKLRELKPLAWYEEKTRNWQSFTIENPDDKEAWFQLFQASYYANRSSDEMKMIVDQMLDKFPGTLESQYAEARVNGWNETGTLLMEKAVAQATKNNQFLAERLILSELSMNRENREEMSNRLYESGIMYSSLLNYCYNMLMSVSDGGILVLEGETTTLPVYVLQDVMNVRKDIAVLNLEFLSSENYLNYFSEHHQLNGLNSGMSASQFVEALPTQNKDREIYYGLTLPSEHLNGLEEKLFVVGLASAHEPNEFDHFAVLKENIENRFLLDYLTVDFSGEPKTATGKVYQVNYILPLLLLKEYYDEAGNTNAAERWSEMILELAEESQIKERVSLLMEKSASAPADFKTVDIDQKNLEKDLMKIKDNLYASAYEVTNRQYWDYMDYLYKNGYTELYEKSKVDLSKYDEITATLLNNYHYSPENAQALNVKRAKADKFLEFPAIDMSYETALGYLEWLTYQYNRQEGRKYKKVEFRLPTEKEWSISALGYPEFQSWNLDENVVKARPFGHEKPKVYENYKIGDYEDVLYPWYHSHWEKLRGSIVNRHGCYLANVKTTDEITCPAGIPGDGWEFTSTVGTYFPNGMGLYDVIGNVAEMIDQPGKAMGGSWNHVARESTISSINSYDGPVSEVGFRIFMEVIEE